MAPTAPLPGNATAVTPRVDLALAEVQGNILGGFNKDHQALLFVRFATTAQARLWLTDLTPHIATSSEVAAFSTAFKAVVARTGSERNAPTATWLNVAFTHGGLAMLGVLGGALGQFPEEFRVGMAARASLIGDEGPNAPANWPTPLRRATHAVVIIAADRVEDLADAVAEQRTLAQRHGHEVVFQQDGATRIDEPGHEHFGFKDGISQPGIRGFTTPANPADAEQGIPGQDLLWPGEFVLGYPRQAGAGHDLTVQGPTAINGPSWTTNGSYLVFRRLRQDVAGFRKFMTEMARQQGVTEELMGAKLVGRYKSGAPLELTGMKTNDPGVVDPILLGDSAVNNFEFGDDTEGQLVPLAAHIRKSYPRDDETKDGGEADTQTHRLLRRGIPFGLSLPAAASGGGDDFPADRGLLFLCYQTSIARQFEFVQSKWVNDPNSPKDGSGHDPIISQVDGARSMSLPGGRPDHVALMQRFVTTTGGDYFFQPSISALRLLSGPQRPAATNPLTPPRRRRPGTPPPRPRQHPPQQSRRNGEPHPRPTTG